MNKLVNLIKWLLKASVVLAVLGALSLFAFYLYEQYQLGHRGREAEKSLSLYTDASDWHWFEEKELGERSSSDVQWRIDEDNEYWLRRVYDGHWVKATITRGEDSELELRAYAYWQVECEAGSEVGMSLKDKSGKALTLRCKQEDWGSYLYAGAIWHEVEVGDLPTWNVDYDGFRVYADFDGSRWNFDAAMRHLTLQALSVPEAEARP